MNEIYNWINNLTKQFNVFGSNNNSIYNPASNIPNLNTNSIDIGSNVAVGSPSTPTVQAIISPSSITPDFLKTLPAVQSAGLNGYALNFNNIAQYANANHIPLDQLKTANLDQLKTLNDAANNATNNAKPDAWSLDGAFGDGKYAGWANGVINGISALGQLYLGYKGLKQSKRALDESIALQRANYRNSARALNNQYRDVLSGRGYNGMSDEAKAALGRDYRNRRVEETY